MKGVNMTENEAKGWLEYIGNMNLPYDRSPKSRKIACDTAIKALEEIQEYRAIGTVKQFEWCKDASHWKELFKDKLEQYEAIGTIDEFKALKEKNELKKVVVEHIPKTSWTKEVSHYLCPSCRSIFSFSGKPYCSNCGQKLDWQ